MGSYKGAMVHSLNLLGLLLCTLAPSAQDGKGSGEEPLPKHAVARLGTSRWRQGGLVNGVALSPDGKTALSASSNRTMTLWDVETGRRLHAFEGHMDEV